MANRIKTLLVTIAIASIALASMPDPSVGASSAKKVKIKGNTYKISGKTATLTKVSKTKTKIVVPDYIKVKKKKYRVTSISARAAKNLKKLKSISIGKYVKTIGKEAFRGCSKLKKIDITSVKLKTVGEGAFIGISGKYEYSAPATFYKTYSTLLKNAGLGKTAKEDKSESDPETTKTPTPTKAPKKTDPKQPDQEVSTPAPTEKADLTTTPTITPAPTNTETPTPTPLPNKRYVITANIASWDTAFLEQCDKYGIERPIPGSVYDIADPYTQVLDVKKNKWVPINTDAEDKLLLESDERLIKKVEQHPSFIALNQKLKADNEEEWNAALGTGYQPLTIYLQYIWEDDKGNVTNTYLATYDIGYMGSYDNYKKTGKPDPDAYTKWLADTRKWVEDNLKSSNPEVRESMQNYKGLFPDLFK